MGVTPQKLLKTRDERIVAALDVGTSKVGVMIAAVEPDQPPRVLGAGLRACNGLRRGLVADMARTESAVRAAMDQAERAAGLQIESIIANLSAGGLDSDAVSVEVDIAGHRIEENDVDALLTAGRQRIDVTGRTVLHAEPTLYTIDGVDGVTNPRGFHANRLAVDIHVITADTPPCRNLDLAVRSAHLNVDTIVASGVATSLAILGPEERELGVAVVEIGAGVTSVTVHGGGMLLGLATIPMGAADITADIATNFSTRRSAAERLKTLHGAATSTPRDNHEMIEVPPLDAEEGSDGRRVAKAELIAVIRARLDLLFAEIAGALGEMGFSGPAGRQVVLTGGGAELRAIADFAQGALGRSVRLGRPRGLAGLPDAQGSAAFACLAGLVLFGATPRIDLKRNFVPKGPPRVRQGMPSGGRLGRLVQLIRKQI